LRLGKNLFHVKIIVLLDTNGTHVAMKSSSLEDVQQIPAPNAEAVLQYVVRTITQEVRVLSLVMSHAGASFVAHSTRHLSDTIASLPCPQASNICEGS